MKILIWCLLAVLLSGCIPIGIQANTRSIHPGDRVGAPADAAPGALTLY
jgi:hypothetical protein